MQARVRSIFTAVFSLLILVGWFFFLRPTMLGGPTTYLMISGISMKPTFYDGDLVLVSVQDNYHVGDIIAYAIDDQFLDQKYVIHRIIGQTADGRFLTQGDNRDDIDPWTPTSEQVIGSAFVEIPRLGVVIAYLQAEPWRFAVAAGVITLFSVIPIGIGGAQKRHRRRDRRLAKRRKERLLY